MVIAPDALVQHCRRASRPIATAPGGRDASDVAGLVDWLNERDEFADHDAWVSLGMALRLELGDDGLDIWRRAHDDTVTEGVEAAKWRSFDTEAKPGCFTLASLMKRAHALGWTGTIRPSAASMFSAALHLTDSPSIVPPLPTGTPAPTDSNAEDNEAYPTPPGGFTKTLAQSLAGFMPPDYLVDGILQRRFCYSMTGQTGTGKTTVAMRVAAHVAIGKPIGEIGVERGNVLYFAGENPTDVQMRWLGLCKEMNLDPNKLDIHVVEGSMHLSKVAERITAEVYAIGKPMALVIVDTAAAYFEEDNDNDNVQAGNHARRLRSLCGLPGGPSVLILCHPTKNATDDNLVPRGGGAFLAEVDGNIALRRDGDTIVAFALGKFRGPEFLPINFTLKVIRDHPRLVDTKGRQVPTIIAVPISAAEQERAQEKASTDEDKVLRALCDNPGMKNSDVGKVMGGWHREKTRRSLSRLAEQGLATSTKDYWTATPKGQKYLNTVATAQPVQTLPLLAPMVLGPSGVVTPTRFVKPPPMPPVPS